MSERTLLLLPKVSTSDLRSAERERERDRALKRRRLLVGHRELRETLDDRLSLPFETPLSPKENSKVLSMDKLREFGRKALFYVRVLSGYEERRIRSLRFDTEKRIKQAEERRAAIRKIPEQAILGEVRRMVEEMQTLNKKLEETEAAIEEYFQPLDKEAEHIMKVQLEGEEKRMREMMSAMQQQALLEKAVAEKNAKVHSIDTEVSDKDLESSAAQQANVR